MVTHNLLNVITSTKTVPFERRQNRGRFLWPVPRKGWWVTLQSTTLTQMCVLYLWWLNKPTNVPKSISQFSRANSWIYIKINFILICRGLFSTTAISALRFVVRPRKCRELIKKYEFRFVKKSSRLKECTKKMYDSNANNDSCTQS